MTDSSNPSAPKIPRKKPRREPATIDLPAKVVDDGRPSDPSAREAERIREAVAMEMAASAGTDPATDSSGGSEPSKPAGTNGDDDAGRGRKPPDNPAEPPRGSSFAPLLAAALLGGVVGGGLMFGLERLQSPPEDQRVTAIEQRLAAIPPAGAPAAAVQALQGRLQALEAAKPATEQRLAAVQNAAEQALKSAATPTVSPQEQAAAVSELTQRLSGLEGQIQSTQLAASEARQTIENQVVDLSKRVSQGPDDTTKAAVRIVLAQRVGDALRLGAPYADTLQALRHNGTEAARLAPLEPFAEKGAPTAVSLAQAFQPLSAAILRDDRADAGSFTDRLLRMTDRIVTIRPVNEPGSTDVPSLVARIDQALAGGNVQDAVSAWDALPEPSRRLSAEWGMRAKARSTADLGAQAIANDALVALNNPTQ